MLGGYLLRPGALLRKKGCSVVVLQIQALCCGGGGDARGRRVVDQEIRARQRPASSEV